MKRDGSEPLTPKQSVALASLLAGKSAEAAAKDAGVDPKTVRKWVRRDRRFIKEFRIAQEMLLGQAKTILTKAVGKAVVVLLETMTCDDPTLRYRAASDNFDRIERLIGEGEIRRRLEALEDHQSDRPRRTRPK